MLTSRRRNRLGFCLPIVLVSLSFVPSNFAASSSTLGGSFGDNGVYKIAIGKIKVEEDDEALTDGNYVTMLNKKSRPFRCSIPDKTVIANDEEKLIDLETIKIENALKPVESNRACIQLVTQGWWHYELCFNKHVVQYHMDAGVIVQPMISLGLFSHSFDWSNVTAKDALKRKDRFHTQHFLNGSDCELTGRRRQTRVKFFCDDTNWSADYIESVTEPESCTYEMRVHTKRLCSIPYFKKDEPVISEISCNPIRTPETETTESSTETPTHPSVAQLGRNLVESILNEAPLPNEEEREEIDIIAGESDSEVAIQNELKKTEVEMNEKLFENAKFSVDADALSERIAPKKPVKIIDGDSELKTFYVDEARKRATAFGKRWIDRDEITIALLRVDFDRLGKLSKEEKAIAERMIDIVKTFRLLLVEDEEMRMEAFKAVSKEYTEIVELFITDSGISLKFKEAFREVFFLMSSMMQQYTRENTRLEKMYAVNPSPTQLMEEVPDKFDEIEITEELLSDGKKIGEAIRKLDFVSIAPLNEAEQAFFESMLSVSEDIMEAFRKIDEIEPDILPDLAEEFRADLVKIKSGMERNREARPIFRHKLGQFLRLKMALLNHLVVEDDDKIKKPEADLPEDDVKKETDLDADADPGNVEEIKQTDMTRLEKAFGGSDPDEATVQQDKPVSEKVLDETNDVLTRDEQEVAALLNKGFENWQVGQLKDDNGIPFEERQIAIRKARMAMTKAAELLRDPKRRLGKEFRGNILKRTESAVVSLKHMEKTEESLHELRQMRKKMETGAATLEDMFSNFDKTLDKARKTGASIKAARAARTPQALVTVPSKALAPRASPQSTARSHPTSRAVQFHDIVAEMDPTVRKVRELEKIVRERLSAAMGGGAPVEVKFLAMSDGGKFDATDLSQLDKIKKTLAGAFATQLQGVFQQHIAVNELEDNYNVDDDVTGRSPKKKWRQGMMFGL